MFKWFEKILKEHAEELDKHRKRVDEKSKREREEIEHLQLNCKEHDCTFYRTTSIESGKTYEYARCKKCFKKYFLGEV